MTQTAVMRPVVRLARKEQKLTEQLDGVRRERDAAMVSAVAQGATLAQVAEAAGVTRQRVHQIVSG